MLFCLDERAMKCSLSSPLLYDWWVGECIPCIFADLLFNEGKFFVWVEVT